MAYQPHLFIDIGKTYAFFTLRETYLHIVYGKDPVTGAGYVKGSEVRSFHHLNLSQDPQEAFDKAESYAKQMGLTLSNKGPKELKVDLRDIKRSNAEQMHAKKVAAAWAASSHVDVYSDRWMFCNLIENPLRDRKFDFGKHAGKTFEEINKIDREYLEFMATPDTRASQRGLDTPLKELRRQLLQTWLDNHESQAIETNNEFVGNEGDKIEACIFIKESRPIETDYGTTCLVKAINEAGNRFTIWYSGSKLDFEKLNGKWLDIKATIKGHDEFRGENSTTLTRVRAA